MHLDLILFESMLLLVLIKIYGHMQLLLPSLQTDRKETFSEFLLLTLHYMQASFLFLNLSIVNKYNSKSIRKSETFIGRFI